MASLLGVSACNYTACEVTCAFLLGKLHERHPAIGDGSLLQVFLKAGTGCQLEPPMAPASAQVHSSTLKWQLLTVYGRFRGQSVHRGNTCPLFAQVREPKMQTTFLATPGIFHKPQELATRAPSCAPKCGRAIFRDRLVDRGTRPGRGSTVRERSGQSETRSPGEGVPKEKSAGESPLRIEPVPKCRKTCKREPSPIAGPECVASKLAGWNEQKGPSLLFKTAPFANGVLRLRTVRVG